MLFNKSPLLSVYVFMWLIHELFQDHTFEISMLTHQRRLASSFFIASLAQIDVSKEELNSFIYVTHELTSVNQPLIVIHMRHTIDSVQV